MGKRLPPEDNLKGQNPPSVKGEADRGGESSGSPQEVIPGIYRLKIPIESPLEFVNAYLIAGQGGWLLVDTGWNTPEVMEAWGNGLGKLGLELRDIARIVITHIHPDHYGLAGKLREMSGAELLFHQIEKDFVESRYVDIDGLLEEMARWLYTNGVPEEVLASVQVASLYLKEFVVPTLPTRVLNGGEIISTGWFDFRVLWTPGHSAGHICLYEPKEKVLLSGDHILPKITPNVSLHIQSGLNPLGDYINSLKAVENLPVDLVLPAHQEIFTDLKGRAGEILQHHQERKAIILDTMRDSPRTAYEISAHIPWNTNGVSWKDLPPLDRRIAVTETLAHLELLRAEGQVDRILRGDIVLYTVATKTRKAERAAANFEQGGVMKGNIDGFSS